MRPIDDHVEMLSLVLCKQIKGYMLENPCVSHFEVLQALLTVQHAVSSSVDDWYEQVVSIVGVQTLEECDCPDFTNFLFFTDSNLDEDL